MLNRVLRILAVSWVGAGMASSSNANARPAGYEPLQLVVEAFQEGVRVSVVGASAARARATFTLHVVSNGNRSLHRGSAYIDGSKPEVLSTVSLPRVEPGQWRAHLSVHIEGAAVYEQVRTEITHSSLVEG